MSNEQYWINHEKKEQGKRDLKAAIIAWLSDPKEIKKRKECSNKPKDKSKIQRTKALLESMGLGLRIVPVEE